MVARAARESVDAGTLAGAGQRSWREAKTLAGERGRGSLAAGGDESAVGGVLLGDDLTDRRPAAATLGTRPAGAGHGVGAHRAPPDGVADSAVANGSAVTDDHVGFDLERMYPG